MEGHMILSGVTTSAFIEAIKEVVRAELKNNEPEELMTREEVAEFLKVNLSTVSTWTGQGKLICYGIGGRRYYKKSEIMSALEILKI